MRRHCKPTGRLIPALPVPRTGPHSGPRTQGAGAGLVSWCPQAQQAHCWRAGFWMSQAHTLGVTPARCNDFSTHMGQRAPVMALALLSVAQRLTAKAGSGPGLLGFTGGGRAWMRGFAVPAKVGGAALCCAFLCSLLARCLVHAATVLFFGRPSLSTALNKVEGLPA